MGVSMAKVTSVSTHSLSSNMITLQAYQLASDKAELLKSETYSSLASQGKKAVAGSLYYDEVTVGKETAMPSNQDIKEKPCRVNVYYGDESIPRATLSFNRYSVSQNESSIPKGTILPWYGKSSDIPEGFALCDGTKGTPNLRNRFLVGAGSNYALGDTGGVDQVTLTGTQIGSHFHYFGSANAEYSRSSGTSCSVAYLPSSFDSIYPTTPVYPSFIRKSNDFYVNHFKAGPVAFSVGADSVHDRGVVADRGYALKPPFLFTSLAVGTDAQEPHENRPPYYALYYIMKLE